MNNATRAAVFIIAAACATLLGAERARARDANQFQVLTAFSAKEACSCAFLVGQTDDYCTAFGQIGEFAVDVSVDRSAKTVKSTFAGTARTARFTEGAGCLTDPLE